MNSAEEQGPAPRWRRQQRAAITVMALAGLTVVALLCVGWLTGWRTHTMTTPSMGRSGQVGSVVVSRPVSATQIHLGDVLVFHPPNRPNITFVHRVISVIHTAAGLRFHTKGDINGAPDPWTLSASTIIGRSVLHIPDVGFLLQMLPPMLSCGFIILLLTHTRRTAVKTPARIFGSSLLAAALIMIYRPLDRIDLIGQVRSGSQGHAAIVPTGVLPVRVSAWHGTHVDLTPGQVGGVVSDLTGHGAFRIDASVHLQGWWWLLLVSWAVPLMIAFCCRPQLAPTSNLAAAEATPRLIPRPAPSVRRRDAGATHCSQGRRYARGTGAPHERTACLVDDGTSRSPGPHRA